MSKVQQEAETESVVVRDRVSRRRFIRAGTAFIITGGSLAVGQALAADCDQNEGQTRRCSDQDTGTSADPIGCGRCGQLAPTSFPGPAKREKTRKIARVKTIEA